MPHIKKFVGKGEGRGGRDRQKTRAILDGPCGHVWMLTGLAAVAGAGDPALGQQLVAAGGGRDKGGLPLLQAQ